MSQRLALIVTAIRRFYGREIPADASLWHPWTPFLPVRLTNGSWSSDVGRVWRRRRDGRWEYRQDPETEEEWAARHW